jgi:polyhydroxybutyrate depolymerase
MEFWAARHGCTGKEMKALPHFAADDPTGILRIGWTRCTIDGAVQLYCVQGGGHRVPSLIAEPEDDWTKKAGPQNHDIETIDAFWEFAKRFTKP